VGLVEASLVNLYKYHILAQVLQLLVLFFPRFKLLELGSLSQVIQELDLPSVTVEISHEIGHRAAVDIVVAGNPAHVSWEDCFSLDVIPNELASIQKLYALGYLVQENHMTCWIHLELIILNAIHCRVLLDSLKEEGFLQPLNTFCDCCNGSSSNLRIDTAFESVAQIAFNGLFVRHHLDVLVHLLVLRENYAFAFNIKLWSSCSSEDLLHVKDAYVLIAACI
jgi:hypothetical protein